MYYMGDAANDILCSLGLTSDEKKVYATVKTKFESHFIKRRNVIFERCKFNQRKQEEGESVDSFITTLHGLAEHCNYGGLHNEMIRDRIVVGLSSSSVSMKLQTDPELPLEKATAMARQHESVFKQQEAVRGEQQKPPSIDAMESRKSGERKNKRSQNDQTNSFLQDIPHPDNYKNKFAPGVAKHIYMGNSTAQQGRQFATNVLKKGITKKCAKQPTWPKLRHSLMKNNF